MKRFLNKTVLVTGASSGMGKAIANEFSKQGANVINADLTPGDGSHKFIKTDVTCEESVKNLYASLKLEFPNLDVLINNAGIYEYGGIRDVSTEKLKRIFDVNSELIFMY